MKIFLVIPILTIVYGAIMVDECPSVPLGCRCSHKKKGFTISCENLKFVSLATLPTNISMDIDLEGNHLQFVNESTFPHPNKIRRLNLKNCGIETLGSRTFYGFSSLKKLDLSRNYLTQISENVFQGLEKTELTVIDLRSNYILSISQRAFENVATELLDLSEQKSFNGKKAELIAYNDFLRLSKVKKLSLDDNQLLCDCNIKWLGNWLGKGRQLSEETKCHYPEQLRGKLLRNLFNSSWNCGDYQESFSLPNFRLIPLTNQIGFENDAIRFSCYSTWILKSYIIWIKNGKELLPDKLNKRIEIRNHSNLTLATYTSILLIHRLHLTDSGKITCQLIVYGSGNVTSTVNLFVVSENSPKCKPIITATEQGSVMWPTAYSNTTIRTKCPYDGFSTAERSCGNGIWENFSMESCFFGNPTTKALQSFYMNAKSADNLKAVVTVCNQFSSFLHQKYKYIKSKFDFYFISRMLFYIMQSSRILDRSQYVNFIWNSIGLIVIKHKELPSLEEKVYDYNALWRFQQLLELFLYEESLKKLWSFSIENHPTMAALSYKTKAKNLVLCYVGSQMLINEGKALKIYCSVERNITMEQNADVSIRLIVPTATVQLSILTFVKNTFFPLHGNRKIISSVVGIQVYNTSTNQQTLENYQILFHFQNNVGYAKPQIVIWDKDESEWKPSPACSKSDQISTNLTHYKCFSDNLDKMMYFALSEEIPAILTIKSQYLEVVIYFGAGLSTILLLLTLLIYCVFRELRLRRNDAAATMNLILSLIVAQISFSCGIHRVNTEFLCKGVALTLHYFLLCSLLWLGCGSFMLLKMLKNKDKRQIKDSVLKYYLISWGLPLIICSITIAYDHKKYKAEQFCWLAPNISIGAFVCPASLFLLCDFVVLCYLHAMINKIYPVLNEVAEENLSSVGQSKLNLKVRKDKKIPGLEYDFPKRDELMSLLHGNLLVLLFFCLLIVFTKMIFIYKDTASGYLYYVFSYASAFCNLFLGLVTVCFYCLPRKDIRTKIKNVVSCFHKRTKMEESVNVKTPNFGESFETNDKSTELLDAVSETHGVFGLSDIVCSEASYPNAAAVGEQQSTYETQSDLLTCKSKLHTIVISTHNKEVDTKAANQVLQKPNQAPSEISGHNSIGECSLGSKRGQKSNPKNPDIPENLRHFVPENWRPVRRRIKKGTSFYPYLNTDNSVKSSSMVHGSNTSSVTSTNNAAVPLHINKKQAAKNLAMYNELFNNPKIMYEPYPTSNGSSFPNTPNSFHNPYNHFNSRTAEERIFSPNLLSPNLFPIQYNNGENTQDGCELPSTIHYNNKNPASFLNTYHEATNNHEVQLFRENNLYFPENISSDTDNMRDSVEKKVKLTSVQEILNDSAVNNDFLEEPLLKKVPILYIPLPHITKKQFELCAETKC